MKRNWLEHLIRAAAAITDQCEMMLVGSLSNLGAVPNAPDADRLNQPELADLSDGAISKLSPFEQRFGGHAQGVGPKTALLPAWVAGTARHSVGGWPRGQPRLLTASP